MGKGNSICKGLEVGCGGGAGRGQVTQGLEGCVGESGLYFGGHCQPWKDSKQRSAWVRFEPEIHCESCRGGRARPGGSRGHEEGVPQGSVLVCTPECPWKSVWVSMNLSSVRAWPMVGTQCTCVGHMSVGIRHPRLCACIQARVCVSPPMVVVCGNKGILCVCTRRVVRWQPSLPAMLPGRSPGNLGQEGRKQLASAGPARPGLDTLSPAGGCRPHVCLALVPGCLSGGYHCCKLSEQFSHCSTCLAHCS